MTQHTANTLRTVLTIISLAIIMVLVYILSQNSVPQPDVLNTGVESPVIPQKIAPAPRGDVDFDRFDDGLRNPQTETKIDPDEFGIGTTNIRVYDRDLNADGRPDRITRTHIENGTSHFTNEYKIELATDSGYVDVTPQNLETIESADCALQKLRFYFDPVFTIEKIGRKFQDTYVTPTMAYKTIYKMVDNQLQEISRTPMDVVCDVSQLFTE